MDQWIRRTYVRIRNAINAVRLLGIDGLLVVFKSALGMRGSARVSISGQSMLVRLGSTDLATLLQIFWHREYELPLDYAPSVIIDGGANVGYSSLFFAQRYPGAKIISVEPHPENFIQLEKNTAGYDQISLVQAAIWHRNENLGLWDPNEGHWGFRVTGSRLEDGSDPLMVIGVTINQLMQQHKIQHIDLLKLDIEGSEKEVFENCEDWIDHTTTIVTELHDKYRVGCSRAFYCAIKNFPYETRLGENILVSVRSNR